MTLQAIFGAAFTPFYGPAVLVARVVTENGQGDRVAVPEEIEIRALQDQASYAERGDPVYAAADIVLIVLQAGVPRAPNKDDRIIYHGTTYSIAGIKSDPAETHWTIAGTRIDG